MDQFQKTLAVGILTTGVLSAGCMSSDPQTNQAAQSKTNTSPGSDKAETSAVQLSFHDYKIPLNLADLEAETVDRAGVARDSVTIPQDFSPRAFVTRIVSGGQTGVDRAALDFGLQHEIQIGGWCPQGRLAEDGVIPSHYPLTETERTDVTWRTELNARDSDGTLVLVENHLMRGTGYTREMAIKYGKPYWIQPIDGPFEREAFDRWLIANEIRVLNIGGPRESDQPGSVHRNALLLLEKIFQR